MLEDIIRERKEKLARLKNAGVNPYPSKTNRTHKIEEVLEKFNTFTRAKKKVAVVGRLMNVRDQGGVMFLDLRDESGEIQAVLKKDSLKNFSLWQSTLDRGDFIGVSGPLFITKRGQKSVDVKKVDILAKSLQPLPGEWFGIEETETRLRKRYLDLLLNPEVKQMFERKARFWNAFRTFLLKEGFKEVELPVLEPLPGGADAEPFRTHHNALDTDFYLRIALELPLKKLLVGGFEKVFEIGRIFRNEGIDRDHLQDYTQLEFYWSYADYNDLMKLLEKLYKFVIKETTGGLVTTFQGQKINWGKKWAKVDYVEIFKKVNGIDPTLASIEDLKKKALSLGLALEPGLGKGRLIDLIFKKTIRPTLIQPAFLINPPVELVPLAKRLEGKPLQVARTQVVACGTELGNGFTELNDPEDQRSRFEEQMKLREAGDQEAQFLDEDFLESLEHGMPPATGFGVSERLFAILMDKPIRETVFFPLMKPKGQ